MELPSKSFREKSTRNHLFILRQYANMFPTHTGFLCPQRGSCTAVTESLYLTSWSIHGNLRSLWSLLLDAPSGFQELLKMLGSPLRSRYLRGWASTQRKLNTLLALTQPPGSNWSPAALHTHTDLPEMPHTPASIDLATLTASPHPEGIIILTFLESRL